MVTSTGTSGFADIYNNLIGDLRAPNASSSGATTPSLRGINLTAITANSNIFIRYNSIYLNGSTSGANFATAGLFATTSTTATTSNLFLNNNIIVNVSTPAGTGRTVAYQRSSTALNNYDNSSNTNLFYAGTPGVNNLIFFDGTNASQTIMDFKAFVTPRETNSVTENAPFLSTSGASPNFLHINPAVPTQIESGAVNIGGIETDYDGDIRQGNPGYAGSGSAPDIGADEGEFSGLDLSAPAISYTLLPNACGLGDITLAQCDHYRRHRSAYGGLPGAAHLLPQAGGLLVFPTGRADQWRRNQRNLGFHHCRGGPGWVDDWGCGGILCHCAGPCRAHQYRVQPGRCCSYGCEHGDHPSWCT
jgi:hypothetical protein